MKGGYQWPPLRDSELDSDSNRYDYLAAAASNERLKVAWITWAALAYFVFGFVLLVFISILKSNRTRKNPFNLYLVYLMIPDLVFSGGCATTCLMNAIKGEYWSEKMCRAQSFYLVFGLSGNCWLNGVVAGQIHWMLKSSHIRRRYMVPSLKEVSVHAMICYAWALFVASWVLIDGIPHNANAIQGLACQPLEYSKSSTLFYFFVYLPFAAFIPMTFALYVVLDVLYRKLLPPRGKRRMLSSYFFRLMVVFLVMWGPYFLVVLVAGSWVSHAVLVAFGSWSHLQGLASAMLTLTKPDVRRSFLELLCCCFPSQLDGDDYASWAMWARRSSRFARSSSRRDNSQGTSETDPVIAPDYLPIQESNYQFDDEATRELSQSVSLPVGGALEVVAELRVQEEKINVENDEKD